MSETPNLREIKLLAEEKREQLGTDPSVVEMAGYIAVFGAHLIAIETIEGTGRIREGIIEKLSHIGNRQKKGDING